MLDRGVGVALQIGKSPFVPGRDRLREIPLCQRLQNEREIIQHPSEHVGQVVHPLGQVAEEALLAVKIQTLREIAVRDCVQQHIQFAFRRDLDGAIDPFHHRAKAFALVVQNRVGHEPEGPSTDLHLAGVGAFQPGQEFALVLRMPVKFGETTPDQPLGTEVRLLPLEIGLGPADHSDERFVQIDQGAVIVGHHHVGG